MRPIAGPTSGVDGLGEVGPKLARPIPRVEDSEDVGRGGDKDIFVIWRPHDLGDVARDVLSDRSDGLEQHVPHEHVSVLH